jgi:hypothetical protein
MDQPNPQNTKIGLWAVAKSVGAAFFGVQSSRNRERDFQHGKASHYIIIGAIFTLLFILGVWLAVVIVLKTVAT